MIAIVVVAYSRPQETRRLVDSICQANFDGDQVDLIVSIDKSTCQQQVHDACADANWEHGAYKIIMRESKMGLRPHILSCGEMTEKYDGVIVLEDDLRVAPDFYRYAKSAMAYYDSDERIAQIALYAYGVNEFISRPFYPAKTPADVYAMQATQSWGECWTRRMWEDFKKSPYYSCAIIPPRTNIPDNVNKWKETSWKKNFTNYLADSGKFVIYPYVSLTTNYTLAGEHNKAEVPDYHVVMQEGRVEQYTFCPLEQCARYDLFFERVDPVLNIPACEGKRVCMDLYGIKRDYMDAEILISTNRMPYAVIGQYALTVKPHEVNLQMAEPGRGIYVYDLSQPVKKLPPKNDDVVIRMDIGCLRWRRTLKHGLRGAYAMLKRKFKGN